MGPFQIHISDKAERLDLNRLDPERKKVFLQNATQEILEQNFEIYRVLIAPMFLSGEPKNKRWRRRKSYKRADRVLIHVEPATSNIHLGGRFPPSISVNGNKSFEFDGEALFELKLPGVFRLKLAGHAKSEVRTKKYSIVSSWTHEFAQWAFFAPRIHNDPNFHVEILCLLPKDLPTKDRFLRCRVKVAEKGRALDEKTGEIYLP